MYLFIRSSKVLGGIYYQNNKLSSKILDSILHWCERGNKNCSFFRRELSELYTLHFNVATMFSLLSSEINEVRQCSSRKNGKRKRNHVIYSDEEEEIHTTVTSPE